MSFHVDHWFGPRYAVLAMDGLVANSKLFRAIDVKLKKPVLLLMDSASAFAWNNDDLLDAFRELDPLTDHTMRVLERGFKPSSHVSFAYMPGVSLAEVVAQHRDLDGEMPLEAAAHIVIAVARAMHAMRRFYLQPVSSERIRIGFDGEVALFTALRPVYEGDDDAEVVIRIIVASVVRRIVPPEPGLAPEEIDPLYETDMRAEVFRLGTLLWLLLDNAHPFEADHPLHQLESLQSDTRRRLRREIPDAVRAVLSRALAPQPGERFPDPAQLADALEHAVPTVATDGVTATKAVACGLFPHLRERQLHELEQLGMVDWVELIADAPTLDMDLSVIARNAMTADTARVRVPPLRMVFRFGSRGLAADNRLVTNRQFVQFLDATGRPDPPSFVGRIPELADEHAVFIGPADAAAYAQWRGGRLPTEPEWNAMVHTLTVPDVTHVWEWTSTPMRTGFVVRGGPWRNRTAAGRVDNRSWEDSPSQDVGFRVFYDGPAAHNADANVSMNVNANDVDPDDWDEKT